MAGGLIFAAVGYLAGMPIAAFAIGYLDEAFDCEREESLVAIIMWPALFGLFIPIVAAIAVFEGVRKLFALNRLYESGRARRTRR